jgi:hypothetical protein
MRMVVILDFPLFRPDISRAGTDRARVMRCRRSLVLAAGCCCCCQPRSGRLCPAAPWSSPSDCPHRGGDGPYPGQARCLAFGFWPECFRRLDVKGGRRPFPKETQSALDIEGKHVTIQGPSPDLTSPWALRLPRVTSWWTGWSPSSRGSRPSPRWRSADALNAALPRKALAAQAGRGLKHRGRPEPLGRGGSGGRQPPEEERPHRVPNGYNGLSFPNCYEVRIDDGHLIRAAYV